MARHTAQHAEYYGGRIKALVELVGTLATSDPAIRSDIADGDFTGLHRRLAATIVGYGKQESCFNCRRSMRVSVYSADVLDGLLVLAMAQEVRRMMADDGLSFTAANQVYLPDLPVSQGILKRQTKCDYLGLVKQPEGLRGTGRWVLTTWAWQLLRGEAIPASVKYWEGHMIGRSDETVTLSDIFRKHTDLVAAAIERRRTPRTDYRSAVSAYHASDWCDYSGSVSGQLL